MPAPVAHSRIRIPLLTACVIALGLVGFHTPSNSEITGSAHDFSGVHENGQICIFCHTAHNADMTTVDAPLWNHEVSTRTYTLYNSPTMDATTTQPAGVSRLCLSCHDGTVAVDSYGGSQGVILLGGDLAIGADGLANDHPVSFPYTDALADLDGELFPPTSSPSGIGSTIHNDLLIGGSLECSSCHDVHNGGAAAAVNDNLLMITQTGSQLCLTCHDK
jgi:predicted CXXCH cytochrome family protein